MHSPDYIEKQTLPVPIGNGFVIQAQQIDEIAQRLITDNTPASRVRRGDEILPPGKHVIGVPPDRIQEELTLLGTQVRDMRSSQKPGDVLRAIAFYHLRFEAIHPLTDGNGRIGRFLMAKQCELLGDVEPKLFLEYLHDEANTYRAVFLAPIEDGARFELLLDLITRLTNYTWVNPSPALPFPLAPQAVTRADSQFRFFPLAQ